MPEERRKKLKAAGWQFGDFADFLGMTAEEKALVEIRLATTREMEHFRDANTTVHVESSFSREPFPP